MDFSISVFYFNSFSLSINRKRDSHRLPILSQTSPWPFRIFHIVPRDIPTSRPIPCFLLFTFKEDSVESTVVQIANEILILQEFDV